MKAIILAAGQAKRLRPITNDTPKCLLKIGSSKIIDYQLNSLQKNGIKDVIVVVGFKADELIKYLLDNHPKINFEFIINSDFDTTNAAYSLWLAKNHLKETLIYLNSDLFCHPKIVEKTIKTKKASATAIQRIPWDKEEVNVIVKNRSKIVEIGKHIKEEDSYGEFIGITKLGKEFNKKLALALNEFVKEKEYKKFAADAINLTIKKWGGDMDIIDVTEWPATEIDTIEDYKKAQEIWGKICLK